MLRRVEAAAIDVIGPHGRDNVTMVQIAESAGCSIGAVQRLFAAGVAVLDWLYRQRIQGLGELRPGAGQDAELAIERRDNES